METNGKRQEFLLFVSGMSVRSVAAIENIHAIGDRYLSGDFSLQIIDISVDKERAIEFQIVAIPTLIRLDPRQTIVGDLSDTKKVLQHLGINEI